MAKEPKIRASAWIEGGLMIGDPTKLKLSVENSGNIPTNIGIAITCPKSVKPGKIEDSFQNLIPRAPAQRSYDLEVDTPGLYTIEDVDITYEKSSKEKEVVHIEPVKFVVHGRPKVQLEIDGDENIVLGEERVYHINLKNTGTASALSSKIDISYPTSVQIISHQLILPELKPNEESIGLIILYPLFTGEHSLKVKAVYSSPPMGHRAPMTFESAEKKLSLNVQRK